MNSERPATTPFRSGQVTSKTAVSLLGAASVMLLSRIPPAGGGPADGSPQHFQKLPDAALLVSGELPVVAEQAGIKFFRQECVLEALHGPVQNGDDHLQVNIGAYFSSFDSSLD